LIRAHPKVPEYQDALARSNEFLGLLYGGFQRHSEAEAVYRQALPVREQLARDYPRVVEYQYSLAKLLKSAGLVYRAHDQLTQAEAAYQKSIEILERLTREHPTVLEYANMLAENYHFIGDLWMNRGNPVAAVAWFDRNIAALEQVLRTEPRHALARTNLSGTHMRRGEALRLMDRSQEARKDWEQAIALGEGQTEITLWLNRVLALALCGEHSRAVNEVEAIIKKGQRPENDLYNFACIYSIASAAASKDANLTPASRSRFAEQYAARAVVLLVNARTAGSFNDDPGLRKWMEKDPDLAAIRSREDFRELLRKLEQDAKAEPKKP
jgi:tetratricopeptide (TPR) repeat protein